MNDIDSQIIAVIEKIKPFLQRDGGDIHYHHYANGIVYITLSGACQDCALIDNDISEGIEIIMQEEVPGVVKVVAMSSKDVEEWDKKQKEEK